MLLLTIHQAKPSSQHCRKLCRILVGATAETCGWMSAGTRAMRTALAKHAAELVALAPDVIFAGGSPSVTAPQQSTRTVPIVFVRVADPVSASFVNSLARPGGNVTGFMLFEYSLGWKWLELLKQIAPGTLRVSVMRDLTNPAGI